MASVNPVIEIHQLSKTYTSNFSRRSVVAVQDVSFQVGQGEIFAMLGLNGAGKSTVIKMLLDLVRPSSGQALLFGEPVQTHRWKGNVGYLPELFRAPESMTARQVLWYLAELSGLRGKQIATNVDSVLEQVDLKEAERRKINTYSKGMVLRLGLAQALLRQPRLLILDEPTEGLDPLGRNMVRGLLTRLSHEGVSVMLNSHLLSEIELVAHRVAILRRGKLVAQGKLHDLLPHDERFEVEIARAPEGDGSWQPTGQGTGCLRDVPVGELPSLLASLDASSVPLVAVRAKRTTLEDIFFTFISKDPIDEPCRH